jgi:hypothetical protein
MNRLLKTLAAIVAIGLVLSLAGIAAIVLTAGEPLGRAVLSINDHDIVLSGLSGNLPALALAGLVMAVVFAVVVPCAIVVPLLVIGLGLALGVLAIVAATALLLSPLWLIGWLIWRVARPARPVRVTAA